LECSFDLECVDALLRHLEGEPWRALDRDLAKAEIFVVKDLGAAVLGHVSVQLYDLGYVADGQFAAFVRRLFRIFTNRSTASMSWTLPRRSLRLRLVNIQI